MRLIWLLDAGYPKPRCNWPVADADGRFIGRPDLLCTELGVYGEFDGAEHRNRGRHRDDVRRHEDFHRAGLEGFVLVGGDISDKSLAVGRMQAAVRRAEQSGVPRAWQIRVNPGPL